MSIGRQLGMMAIIPSQSLNVSLPSLEQCKIVNSLLELRLASPPISQRELPSLEVAANAVVPVKVFELRDITLDSTDSAPPIDPPVRAAGAEADAAELPRDIVQFWPFSCTCTYRLPELSALKFVCEYVHCVSIQLRSALQKVLNRRVFRLLRKRSSDWCLPDL